MSLKRKILVAVMGAGLAICGVASASAATWAETHPRRVEVNHRLAHQDMRIDRNLRDGRMSPVKAAYLHREDRMIRTHERRDAALHGGHLTFAEQARLNHQENRASRQIYRDAH